MRISDWSSDVCSSDLSAAARGAQACRCGAGQRREGRPVMFESLFRHPMRLLVAVIALLVILSQTLAIVPEDRQALVLRFGEIEATKNVYRPGERFGRSGAGLLVRMPFVDGVQRSEEHTSELQSLMRNSYA